MVWTWACSFLWHYVSSWGNAHNKDFEGCSPIYVKEKTLLALNAFTAFLILIVHLQESDDDPSNVSNIDTGAFSLVSAELLDVVGCCTASNFFFSSSAGLWTFAFNLKMSPVDRNFSLQNRGSRAEARRLGFVLSSENLMSFCHLFEITFSAVVCCPMPVHWNSQMKWPLCFLEAL